MEFLIILMILICFQKPAMEPKMFASILTEKLEKIKVERDIEEKWDNKMIKNLSEVCELNIYIYILFTVFNCFDFF